MVYSELHVFNNLYEGLNLQYNKTNICTQTHYILNMEPHVLPYNFHLDTP
jgi:hypothetical protein